MAKAELKTKKTNASVMDFLKSVKDVQKRADCAVIIKLMQKATRANPKMWGSSIIGFGDVHLKYPGGRELDWFKMGFSPRKQALTLYGCINSARQSALLKKLGKYKTGKGCLYIKKLSDINLDVLKEMIVPKK